MKQHCGINTFDERLEAPGTFDLLTRLVDSCKSKNKTYNLKKEIIINILSGHFTKKKKWNEM